MCAPLGPDGFFLFAVATSAELVQLSLDVDDGLGHAAAHCAGAAGLQFFSENFEAESEGFCLSRHRA